MLQFPEGWHQIQPEEKKVIFIDEISWMDTPKSNFVSALEHFWNSWCSARKDVLLIICASATSWIINKVIKDRGGLHNRVNTQIYLMPFTLKECEEYLQSRNIRINRYQILTLYMVMGGPAYYWSLLQRGNLPPRTLTVSSLRRTGNCTGNTVPCTSHFSRIRTVTSRLWRLWGTRPKVSRARS